MFGKLIVPIITPVYDGKVDIDSLKQFLSFLEENKVNDVFVLGTTGEFLSMTQKQKIVMLQATEENFSGNVLVGVSNNDNDLMEELAIVAEEKHVQAAVFTPMLHDDPELALQKLKSCCELPIILYNNPDIHPGKEISKEFLDNCRDDNRIVGIKDSSSKDNYVQILQQFRSEEFVVYSGSETKYYATPELFDGVVAGTANCYPEEVLEVLENKENLPNLEHIRELLKNRAPNNIMCYKLALVDMDIIISAEVFGR